MVPNRVYNHTKIGDIGDDHCQEYCKYWLKLIGIKNNKAWTIHSTLLFLSLILSAFIWLYTLTDSDNSDQVLHYLALHILAAGLFALHISKHECLLDLARKADEMFIYSDGNLRHQYKLFQNEVFSSWLKKYSRIFTIFVFVVWGNMWRLNLQASLLISLDESPPFMKPIFKTPWWAIFMHIIEFIFIVTAILVDVMVSQIFVEINLQLCAHLKTLHLAFETIKGKVNDSQEISSELKMQTIDCIKHHQLIFSTFQDVKSFYTIAFHIIYFGMLSAIAFCRTLLIGERIEVLALCLLLSIEMGYIHIFCISADNVAEMSHQVSFAVYSSDWTRLPKSICRSFSVIMARTMKPPKMYFFIGGSQVSCETFVLIINATFTFFTLSVLFQ